MGVQLKSGVSTGAPAASYYKPVGIPMRDLDEIVLAIDELEPTKSKSGSLKVVLSRCRLRQRLQITVPYQR